MTATTAPRSTVVARPRSNRREPGAPGRRAGTRVGAAPVLALAGVALAAYLSVVHDDQSALVCAAGDSEQRRRGGDGRAGGRRRTRASRSSANPGRSAPGAPQAALLPGFGGVLFSAYLTWEEVAVIGATYQWCAVSAVLVAVLLAAEGAQAAETRRPGEG